MARTNLFHPDKLAQVRSRVEALEPDRAPEWGTMNAAQMLAHCAEVLDVTAGKELRQTPFFLRWLGPLVKRMILAEGPYRRNMRTHPQYIMTGDFDFGEQKSRLLEALETASRRAADGIHHPIFGRLTGEESGWMSYRHLDHHLRQFGV